MTWNFVWIENNTGLFPLRVSISSVYLIINTSYGHTSVLLSTLGLEAMTTWKVQASIVRSLEVNEPICKIHLKTLNYYESYTP